MIETTIVSIDCATDDAKVGLAVAEASRDGCIIREARVCRSDESVVTRVVEWIATAPRILLALDAPLGWPQPLGDALKSHVAGVRLEPAADDLFRRATDRFVRTNLGKQSLDVGADRIARTAYAALRMLDEIRRRTALPIPLAWESTFGVPATAIEVYPAATLIAHGLPSSGYKKADGHAERRVIIEGLRPLVSLPEDVTLMEGNPDALDAALCVVAGFDFLLGAACTPEKPELAAREGWIWVRRPNRPPRRAGAATP